MEEIVIPYPNPGLSPGMRNRPSFETAFSSRTLQISRMKFYTTVTSICCLSVGQRSGSEGGGRGEGVFFRPALHQCNKDAVGWPRYPGGLWSQERVSAVWLHQIVSVSLFHFCPATTCLSLTLQLLIMPSGIQYRQFKTLSSFCIYSLDACMIHLFNFLFGSISLSTGAVSAITTDTGPRIKHFIIFNN